MNELILRSLRDADTQRLIQRLYEGWHTYLEQVIRNGKEQGMFQTAIDPDKAATQLIIVVKGTTLHYMTDPETVDFEYIRINVEHWLTG